MAVRIGVLLIVTACGTSGSSPARTEPPTAVTVESDAATADAAPVSGRMAMVAMLVAKGYTATAVSPDETLVCASRGCVCMVELGCTGASCITLDENLDGFKTALASKTVVCELADTGRLCDGSFFRFEGDIHRLETRYFGPDGRLIGQRNATDYAEYCGGKTMYQFAGTIPDCALPADDLEVICSDGRKPHPVPNPLDFLLWSLNR